MNRTGCGHIHCVRASLTIHESCYEPLAGTGERKRPPIAIRLQFRSSVRWFVPTPALFLFSDAVLAGPEGRGNQKEEMPIN